LVLPDYPAFHIFVVFLHSLQPNNIGAAMNPLNFQGSVTDEDVVLIDNDGVRDLNTGNILPLSNDEKRRIRDWLNPTQYDNDGSEYQRHRSAHLTGTGSWVFSSASYQQWYNHHEDSVLWIRGEYRTSMAVPQYY
jgi:hypothetical protein